MLTEIPNGLDEIIAAYGSLDDPQFENKHIVSFDLPYTLRYEGQPVKHSRCHKAAVRGAGRRNLKSVSLGGSYRQKEANG